MPEGPSIFILKEETQQFKGKQIIAVSGNTSTNKDRLLHQKVIDFKSWGKHFLICFEGFTLRIHFLLFGTYRINEAKDSPVRLNLTFDNGELNLYSCSIQFLEGPVDFHYDWTTDVMNDLWDPGSAQKKLKKATDKLICDTLLEQDIFSGVGNIIKNEVLYRVRIHPESLTGKISAAKRKEIVAEARTYSFEFLEWKKKFELKKHWLAHTKKECLRCNLPMIKKYTGEKNAGAFFVRTAKSYIHEKRPIHRMLQFL